MTAGTDPDYRLRKQTLVDAISRSCCVNLVSLYLQVFLGGNPNFLIGEFVELLFGWLRSFSERENILVRKNYHQGSRGLKFMPEGKVVLSSKITKNT